MTQSRRFYLQRDTDISGVSGTGHVADGVLWPDGTVSIRWSGPRPSTVAWDRLDDAEHVHCHNGATRIIWIDSPETDRSRAAAANTAAAAAGVPQNITADQLLPWLVAAWQRNLQVSGGQRILLSPLPPCPACGARVTDADTQQTPASLTTILLGMQPCGHVFRCQDATIGRLSEQARHLAEERLNRTPDSTETAGS